MLFLLLCCDIGATYVDNHKGGIRKKAKQQYKNVSREKTEKTYGGRTHRKDEID